MGIIVGGIGTGKTLAVGMSAVVWGILTPGFKFMNVARIAYQSELMWKNILEFAQDTKFEKIGRFINRPYPQIVIEYRLNGCTIRSTLEFMSFGDKKNATNIFSWRGDWVNIDEAGLMDNLQEVVANLQTRLTGSSPDGRPFMGRLTLLSNPWDNPELWILFDMAEDDDDVLALTLKTGDNKNVTEKQIKNLLRTIPEEDHARFLNGERPQGKGNYFSKDKILTCEDEYAGAIVEKLMKDGKPGFYINRIRSIGVTVYETPPSPDGIYIELGDPGIANPPLRNSPVLMTWNCYKFPEEPLKLTQFWWGFGNGSITPFTDNLYHYKEIYKPVICGIDSTGPQKNMAELLNIYHTDMNLLDKNGLNHGGDIGIAPLDFSGGRKNAYLISLRLLIEANKMLWPRAITGIKSQLGNYDPVLDRSETGKLAQDIVSAMAMTAYVAMNYFGVSQDELMDIIIKDLPKVDPSSRTYIRSNAQSRSIRSQRSR